MRITVDVPDFSDGSSPPAETGGSLTIDDGRLDEHRTRLTALGDTAPTRRAFAAVHVVMRSDYAELSSIRAGGKTPDTRALVRWARL